jgi:hypothetical protein
MVKTFCILNSVTFVHLVSINKGCSLQLAQFDSYQVSVRTILCKIVLGSCSVQHTETSVYFNAPPSMNIFGNFLCCAVICRDAVDGPGVLLNE